MLHNLSPTGLCRSGCFFHSNMSMLLATATACLRRRLQETIGSYSAISPRTSREKLQACMILSGAMELSELTPDLSLTAARHTMH
jgi:hypothetical protein